MSLVREIPEVSIVMPVFNNEGALRETLDAILGQNLKSFELIAVDDCSTDGSLKLLNEYMQRDSRIQVYSSEMNGGAHEARRKGIEKTRAPWIGFVDADDIPDSALFEQLLSATTSGEPPCIVACSVHMIDESGIHIGCKELFEQEQTFKTDIFGRFCRREFGSGMLWNKLYRSDLMKRYGGHSFSCRQDAGEDTLVNIGCFFDAKTVQVIPGSLYGYRKHAESATQAVDYAKRYTRLLAAYLEALVSYEAFGELALQAIDRLYRLQLDQRHCGVREPSELEPQRDSLSQVVKQLAEKRPSAIYEMLNQGIANPQFFVQHSSLISQWLEMNKRIIARLFKKR